MTLELKLDRFRQRLQRSLATRFLLRFHIALILLFSISVGWLVDLALLYSGVLRMPLRYPLAILAAYLGFIAGVYLWIQYSGIKDYLSWRKAQELVGDDIDVGGSWEFNRGKGGVTGADFSGFADGEGCLIVIAIVFVAVVIYFAFGGYLIANAVPFFADIVLEVLLAAGLLRGIRTVESSGWVISVWRATRWSLAFALFVALLVGWWAQAAYPNATTLPQVFSEMY